MSEQNIAPVADVYATLAAPIGELTVQRIFHNFAIAINTKVQRIHLLLQSSGGNIGDGIAAYNFIRNMPIEVISYNAGGVQSAAVLVFLGAKKRKASKAATFMIHRGHFSTAVPASSAHLQAQANALAIDDARMEIILRTHISMPEEKWDLHKKADLWITAVEAREYGLIDEIAEFSPPLGSTLFNVLG